MLNNQFTCTDLLLDCDCPWNELCTAPHGDCVCGEHQVREHHGGHGGPCVDCDPDLCK